MLTLRNVTFLTGDPGRLADFWAAALGLPERRDAGSVHLDLTAVDRAAEVRRLVGLGAVEVRTVSDGEMTWTVLLDPDGNELCVSQG